MLEKAKKLVRDLDRDDSHGYSHACRVLNLVKKIACMEGIVNISTDLQMAAILHDVDGSGVVEKFLKTISYPSTYKVLELISTVSFKKEISLILTLEQKILQDADRIDAMGVFGIGRCFMYSGEKGHTFEDTIKHFDDKLLKIYGMLKTKSGKIIGEQRHQFLLEFIKQYKMESNISTPLLVYTDGAFNGKIGGWGVFIDHKQKWSGKLTDDHHTNNRAELTAILQALTLIKYRPLLICSDSMYCINTVSGAWKAKKNLDLIEKIRSHKNYKFKYVKAHTGKKDGNYYADYLASKSIT